MEKRKFFLICPKCGKKHDGKRMMFYAKDKTCDCGHCFSDEWMKQELEKYQAEKTKI